jgi:sporulation protein YlmC with PRC-barrel domain
MQLCEKLLTKLVISTSDGRIAGTVQEFYFDANLEQITAVRLGGEGLLGSLGADSLFSRNVPLIQRADVTLFGIDTLLIKDSKVVVKSNEVADFGAWVQWDRLKGREVVTPGGTEIGTIGDVVVDWQGKILGFKLGHIKVKGSLADKKLVGREAVITLGDKETAMSIDLARAEQLAAELRSLS